MPKTFPFYGVAKMEWCSHGQVPDKPYYVFETFLTIDGPRTRVARGGFGSAHEAVGWIAWKQRTAEPVAGPANFDDIPR